MLNSASMLDFVHLENFRCFRDARIRLGALTALVGPNASGKTALLHAITGRVGSDARDTWQHQSEGWRIECGCTPAGKMALLPNASNWSEWHHRGQYLHLDVSKIREHRQAAEEPRLSEDGSNLTNVFATLPRRVQEQLSRQLADFVPVLGDVDVRPSGAGNQRIVFQDRWKPELWYEPHEVSDGTLLTLGLLLIQHQQGQVEVLGIEEPEHGLHPYLLREVVSVLRKLTQAGPQIVLATQSAELLDYLEPEEVRFLRRRSEDGSVVVEEAPTGTEDWRRAYEVYQESLGSLWLSGNVGGVPGSP